MSDLGSGSTCVAKSSCAKTYAYVVGIALAFGVVSSQAADTIKMGLLEDSSGVMASAGVPKVDAVKLAVKELNEKGGVLGKQIQLIYYDTQSSNSRYQEFARRLVHADHVDVVLGGYNSSAREAIRPVVRKTGTPYIYNNDYEGGVCDANTYVTGPVPEMQWSKSIPWMMEKFGKHVYYIGADYNFGQIQYQWVEKYVKENGGEIVGKELIPVEVTQYGQTIQNIQKAKPDFIVTEMVGSNQVGFYSQKASAGVEIPMISSLAIANEHEQTRFAPPTMGGMHVPANFVDELGTPAADAFVKKMKQAFPKLPYVGQIAADSYNGVYLYAEAVKKAGSVAPKAVRAAFESGDICVDGPAGRQCIVPQTHHSTMPIYLISVTPEHKVVVETHWDMQPSWLRKIGCDLTKKDQYTQYTLDDLKGTGKN